MKRVGGEGVVSSAKRARVCAEREPGPEPGPEPVGSPSVKRFGEILEGKKEQPEGTGDLNAFVYLRRAEFDVFYLSLLPLAGVLGTEALWLHVKGLLGGYSALSRNHWVRTAVMCIDEDDKRVVFLGRRGSVGHAQLIAIAKYFVVLGVCVDGDRASVYNTGGTRCEQRFGLGAFVELLKRTSGIKGGKAIHTALLRAGSVDALCSSLAHELLAEWCGDGAASMSCLSCGDIVSLSALAARRVRAGSHKDAHRPGALCRWCCSVVAFKCGSYARTAHFAEGPLFLV
mgnify:CR=1 FL=1